MSVVNIQELGVNAQKVQINSQNSTVPQSKVTFKRNQEQFDEFKDMDILELQEQVVVINRPQKIMEPMNEVVQVEESHSWKVLKMSNHVPATESVDH